MTETVVVLGAGGHARVVLATVRAAGVEVAGVFDDDSASWGSSLEGFEVVGPLSRAEEFARSGIIAVGGNKDRQRIARSLALDWVTVIHPAACVDDAVQLGRGTIVFAGATVQTGVSIGSHAIVNTGAIIDHDCRVGSFAHIAPGATLAGGVSVGEGALVGVGSSAIPKVSIGEWSVIGAGAVVVRDVGSRQTVVGIPARPLES